MANNKKTKDEILDSVFNKPEVKYELNEFSKKDLESLVIDQDKNKFYVACPVSQKRKVAKPEEIIRQLWINKLTKEYGYPLGRIVVEKDIHFGREIKTKAADLIIYKKDKITPYIIFEFKQPNVKKAEEQLKGYLNAEGCEIGVWSNGKEKFILYRQYPKEFVNTLPDIPKANQTIDDLFTEKKYYKDLYPKFDLVWIIKRLEELVLAAAGVDVFDEFFKIIYAKLYDEKEAKERRNGEILFRSYREPQKTYDVISKLFDGAKEEWQDTFSTSDKIELAPEQLNICIPLLESIKFFDADRTELEIIDFAFEYLITQVAKGSKGQYFTPRHVVRMCVKMLNPQDREYVIDPACGSGGFLIHSMYWVWDNYLKTESAKLDYAKKYVFGLDFALTMRKISQALMLIAGDGRSHIFRKNTLDARDWQLSDDDTLKAKAELSSLLKKLSNQEENKENQKTYRIMNFDLLLTNPPFAGEITDGQLLRQFDLAKKKSKLKNKMERHILFIERDLDILKPGGRMAIVLPQGVLNGTNMEYVREFLFDKARILAVVGLEANTFKPHAGVKTSVLFLQKWDEKEKPLNDYPIFMAVSKKSGKDNSGDYIFIDKNGKRVVSNKILRGVFEDEKVKLDTDLDEISEEFIKFAKKEKFDFWR